MWDIDIVWVTPQGHRSVSVSRHFLLQAPQCPCSVRKRFSRDHCCRGRSKPGCQIVGSHTKWELITWADFQFQASIDYWCQLVASPATAASWMSVAAMMSWYYTVCQKWDETCLILNLKSDHAGRLADIQLKFVPCPMRFLPQLLGNGWGLRIGVEMGTYWRPTVPNPHASPKVRCAVSEIWGVTQ